MQLPTSTAQWTVTGQTGFDCLKFHESVPVPNLGASDVLVQMHYASLNFREILIATGQYPVQTKADVVPGSDGAGTGTRPPSHWTWTHALVDTHDAPLPMALFKILPSFSTALPWLNANLRSESCCPA